MTDQELIETMATLTLEKIEEKKNQHNNSSHHDRVTKSDAPILPMAELKNPNPRYT